MQARCQVQEGLLRLFKHRKAALRTSWQGFHNQRRDRRQKDLGAVGPSATPTHSDVWTPGAAAGPTSEG